MFYHIFVFEEIIKDDLGFHYGIREGQAAQIFPYNPEKNTEDVDEKKFVEDLNFSYCFAPGSDIYLISNQELTLLKSRLNLS